MVGGMPDHIHILAKLKPKLAVSDVVRDKGGILEMGER